MRIAARARRSSPGRRPVGLTTPSVAAPSRTRFDTADTTCVSTRRSTSGNTFANPAQRSISALRGNSASTQSDTDASVPITRPAVRRRSPSTSASTRRAAETTARPSSVRRATRVDRSQIAMPRRDSRVDIAVLTADCTRRSLRAAAEKLPSSTTVTSARSWSRVTGSSMANHLPGRC